MTNNNHEVIFAIVNAGFAEDVMDVARELGVRGGTILNARGVAREDAAAFFGITLHAEKEILMMVVGGMGTANSEIIDMLGLNRHKAVILSVVREDMVPGIMNSLEEKFETIKNGKGIAFAVPLSSVIGVNLYRFLSNNR